MADAALGEPVVVAPEVGAEAGVPATRELNHPPEDREKLLPKTRHIPERSCAACGLKLPKRNLTRIVRTPDGEIRIDPSGKAAGRGAYLCESPACWERGISKGGLERGLHSPLSAQAREHLLSFHQQRLAELLPLEKENDL